MVAHRHGSWVHRSRRRHGAGVPGDGVSIIKHDMVPQFGGFEVRFADGRPSKYFYWDDVIGDQLRPGQLTSEEAGKQAAAFAQAEREKDDDADCGVEE